MNIIYKIKLLKNAVGATVYCEIKEGDDAKS